MMRVLVTGADGQLGKCIQKISDNHSNLKFEFHNSKALDITNSEKTSSIFSKGNYDYCINCAAYTNVEQAEKTPEPAYAVNAQGVLNLAQICAEEKVVLIHISTDYVFDGSKQTGYFPNDVTNPINEYGKTKLQGEDHIQELLKKFFIVRTSWLYSEFGKNFYTTILSKAQAGDDLKITDEQTGCPTNANNLAAYILKLIDDKATNYGIHHFTDGEAMTWYDFAERILKENNLKDKVKLDRAKNYRTFASRPQNSILASLFEN